MRAKDNYDIALKKDPNFQKAYHKKGDCHFFLKEYHKAIETYELGLKKDPTDNFCRQGVEKTQTAIVMGSSQEEQQQRAQRAMSDP
jgi:stress-induced-phosphoprotein 1